MKIHPNTFGKVYVGCIFKTSYGRIYKITSINKNNTIDLKLIKDIDIDGNFCENQIYENCYSIDKAELWLSDGSWVRV